ncbi:GNAT family N-acetyltransferase [Oceanicola sp. 22II-s10i]|uniref:GNAT family N-acetyltransferase n=1 Tax=Oceanicola sp. 22II-s10i TaxID=1317116 RepID=UPI00113062B6|nr:GNAT family N-acetyltransferase [Oceanicola sp. 22II-s10i]
MDHADIAMFALSNLDTEGLARDGAENPARSIYAWIDGEPVTACIAITAEGMILPVLPDNDPRHWAAVAPHMAGRRAFGVTGEAGAARAGFDMLGLARQGCALDRDEPHFVLPLEDMVLPDMAGFEVLRPEESHRALMIRWRMAYHLEILGTNPMSVERIATADIDRVFRTDSYRLLVRDGEVVSMAGINAAAGDVVQIGGVFTPPELRGRGLARRAVAGMLDEKRRNGIRRAVLFAASDMAAKAYVAIGFRRIGSYTLTLFDPPVRIPA